jgi:hypothetical protein
MFLNVWGRRLQLNARLSLVSPQLLGFLLLYCCHKSTSRVLYSLFSSLYYHFYSFDMILFNEQPMEDPVNDLTSTEFYELSSFWPAWFREVVDNLHLIPCSATRCVASKDVAVFLMLRWWKEANKWEDVTHVMWRGPVWCIKIYIELFNQLDQNY